MRIRMGGSLSITGCAAFFAACFGRERDACAHQQGLKGCHEHVQARAKELAEHEEQLGDWKARFKAEAARQIGQREAALGQWQARLEASRAELEDLKKGMEVLPATAMLPVRCHASLL